MKATAFTLPMTGQANDNEEGHVNETKLQDLIGKAVTELSAAESAPLIYIGDKLGLYRAHAE